jgi:hypothetical protein
MDQRWRNGRKKRRVHCALRIVVFGDAPDAGRRLLRPANAIVQAFINCWPTGSVRMRLPVAAKIALSNAGA